MQPLDSADLIKARDTLRSGGVVAIPTETVYGLAASIASDEGLRRIFSLKERPFFDPLIVHVASLNQAKAVAREWPAIADYVARVFWPGPLTIVLPKSPDVNPIITSGLDTVAIRFPAHPLAQDLIHLVGTPLAAPSANKFGRTSPSTAEHVRGEFAGEDLLILDGGPSDVGVESTVISFAPGNEIRILRPGAVTKEKLEQALARTSFEARVVTAQSSESPGHLKHHYMPKIPLAIVNVAPDSRALSAIAKDLTIASPKKALELELPKEAEQAARLLYSEMRRLSEDEGADLIWVLASKVREGGLWTAIWDRLTRAASWNRGSFDAPDAKPG